MSNFLNFASVTKKITLAILGAFLMIFLLVHAGINLCLLRSDGGEWFRTAAHFMGTNYIVKVFEVVLFACLICHIVLGLYLQMENRRARGNIRYKISNKSKTRPGSKLMRDTGILVFIFLAIHLCDFYFVKVGLVQGVYMVELKDLEKVDPEILNANQEKIANFFVDETKPQGFKLLADNLSKADLESFGSDFTAYEPDFYNSAKAKFSISWISIIYIVLLLALGIHLRHAFGSAFQTLGWNHPKYNKAIEIAANLYSALIIVMFCAIPLYFWLLA